MGLREVWMKSGRGLRIPKCFANHVDNTKLQVGTWLTDLRGSSNLDKSPLRLGELYEVRPINKQTNGNSGQFTSTGTRTFVYSRSHTHKNQQILDPAKFVMDYVYDDFTWAHCEQQGYNMTL